METARVRLTVDTSGVSGTTVDLVVTPAEARMLYVGHQAKCNGRPLTCFRLLRDVLIDDADDLARLQAKYAELRIDGRRTVVFDKLYGSHINNPMLKLPQTFKEAGFNIDADGVLVDSVDGEERSVVNSGNAFKAQKQLQELAAEPLEEAEYESALSSR